VSIYFFRGVEILFPAGLTAHWSRERQGRPVRLKYLLLPERPRKCVEWLSYCNAMGKVPAPLPSRSQRPKNTHTVHSHVLFTLRKRQLYCNVDILNFRFRELTSIPPPAGLEELIAEHVSYGVPNRSL
jgi:hypothetical protein